MECKTVLINLLRYFTTAGEFKTVWSFYAGYVKFFVFLLEI